MSGRPERADGPDADSLREVALKAGAGDENALRLLVSQTSRTVWRICAALVDAGAADDLSQETYLQAMRSLPGYRGDSPPLPWLAAIARRVCADEITRRQRARATLLRIAMQRPPLNAEPVLAIELSDAIGRLSAERREALLLTAIAGLSYADAAIACGCPVGTIRSRVARARAELAEALGLADIAEPHDAAG